MHAVVGFVDHGLAVGDFGQGIAVLGAALNDAGLGIQDHAGLSTGADLQADIGRRESEP